MIAKSHSCGCAAKWWQSDEREMFFKYLGDTITINNK